MFVAFLIGFMFRFTAPLIYPEPVYDCRQVDDMSFSSNHSAGGDRPLAVGKSTMLTVYLPNAESKLIKYVTGTNIQTICDLVVSQLGHGERPYSRSYALFLRHTDPSKVGRLLSCLARQTKD